MRNFRLSALMLFFLLFAQTENVSARLLRISTTQSLENPTTDSLYFMAKQIDLIPTLEAKVYPEPGLAEDEDIMRAIQYAIIETAVVPGKVIGQVFPRLSVLSFPYLFQDEKDLQKVLLSEKFNQNIEKDLQDGGYHLLYWAIAGEASVSFTRLLIIPDMVLLSAAFYQSLSEVEKARLDRAAGEAQDYQWREWEKKERPRILKLMRHSLKSDKVRDLQPSIEATKHFRDDYRRQYGSYLLDIIEKLKGDADE